MVSIRGAIILATLVLTSVVFPPGALSQDLAAISGIVADASGGALVGATVVVKNLETGAVRQVTSDAAGRYAVPALAVGRYSVTANKPGFQAASRSGVSLVVGQQASPALYVLSGEFRSLVIPLILTTSTISGKTFPTHFAY